VLSMLPHRHAEYGYQNFRMETLILIIKVRNATNGKSRAQTLPSHEEKGLGTFEQFLGGAESALLISSNACRCRVAQFHGLVQIKTADSAQTRNCSIVTRLLFL